VPGVQILLICAAGSLLYLGGHQVVRGVKVVDRKVCHIATLGHKCKPKVTAPPAPQK
jgi:hypothetical protein